MSYIIIRGPLGIGKSTIARKLTKILSGEYISIDEVLEKNNLDKVDKGENKILLKNFIEGNNIIIPKIKEHLKKGKVVIIDGCFYHKEQIDHFIKTLKSKYFVFTLKASLDTCIIRDKEREKSYGEGAATVVFNMVSKFDYGNVVETENKSIKETVNEILEYVN
jgi:tRNA uridine 5-carbamoylmethylation protein Kti12